MQTMEYQFVNFFQFCHIKNVDYNYRNGRMTSELFVIADRIAAGQADERTTQLWVDTAHASYSDSSCCCS